MSRSQLVSRCELWLSVSKFKYISASNFRVIMHRHLLATLRSCIRFSDNINIDDDESVTKLSLYDYFVTAFNRHCSMYVDPSELICVDKSISR